MNDKVVRLNTFNMKFTHIICYASRQEYRICRQNSDRTSNYFLVVLVYNIAFYTPLRVCPFEKPQTQEHHKNMLHYFIILICPSQWTIIVSVCRQRISPCGWSVWPVPHYGSPSRWCGRLPCSVCAAGPSPQRPFWNPDYP